MAIHQKPQPDGGDMNFTVSIPYHNAIQIKHLCGVPEDAESDSKSLQVPSLSADDSSRATSINGLECRSEADDSGRWLPHEDGLGEHTSVLRGSWSPTSIKEPNFNRTPTDIGTLPNRTLCDPRHMSLVVPEEQPKTANSKQNPSMVPPAQTLTLSAESMSTNSAAGESKSLAGQPTLDSELSDSDSESEEDSDDDNIPDDEWSGTNDNIEAALYQAVYPDLKLAVHLISTMYPTIVLSYKKKITSKVHSWQEKNITTCVANSGTTSPAKETSPQGTSNAANKSSPKRDRLSSSPDDNIGDEEDDDADEGRRKRFKEKSVDSGPDFPEQRLACPFFKKDPSKYSVTSSKHYRVCGGPGWRTIQQLKEHLKRAHRPVQCARCYQTFPYKGCQRSSAIEKLAEHLRQEKRCDENSDSLKEGINDVEWSRLGEKKKNRKGKGKGKAATPEEPQSALDQWYEIWVTLFRGSEAPQTPWYEPPFFASIASCLPQGQQNFLHVLEKVGQQKLPEVRAVAIAGTDEELMAVLLNLGQKTFSTCAATYSLTADASTSSFFNIDGRDPLSSSGSGSWQPVDSEPPLPPQSLSQTDHSVPASASKPEQTRMDGRETNMDPNSQLSPNAVYVGTSRNIPNYNYGASLAPAYPETDQTVYHNPPSGQTTFPNGPNGQVAFPNGQNSTPTGTTTMWPPNMFMNAPFHAVIPNIPNTSNMPNRWGDQAFGPSYRGYREAP